MMKTFEYIVKKYNLNIGHQRIIEIPDMDRNDLAKLFAKLKFEKGAEIGVERGIYSEVLLKANPKLHLYSVDPWKGYRKYEDMKNQHYLNVNYNITRKRLAPYKTCEIIRKSSEGALKDFAPRTLDFVYIDGNHAYEYVWEDLNGWSKVIRLGGIAAGHDYRGRKNKFVGLEEAVNRYTQEHNLKLFTTPKNGDSSWFFVKQ